MTSSLARCRGSCIPGVKVSRQGSCGQCGSATSLPPERAMTIAITTARTRMDPAVAPTRNGLSDTGLSPPEGVRILVQPQHPAYLGNPCRRPVTWTLHRSPIGVQPVATTGGTLHHGSIPVGGRIVR